VGLKTRGLQLLNAFESKDVSSAAARDVSQDKQKLDPNQFTMDSTEIDVTQFLKNGCSIGRQKAHDTLTCPGPAIANAIGIKLVIVSVFDSSQKRSIRAEVKLDGATYCRVDVSIVANSVLISCQYPVFPAKRGPCWVPVTPKQLADPHGITDDLSEHTLYKYGARTGITSGALLSCSATEPAGGAGRLRLNVTERLDCGMSENFFSRQLIIPCVC